MDRMFSPARKAGEKNYPLRGDQRFGIGSQHCKSSKNPLLMWQTSIAEGDGKFAAASGRRKHLFSIR